MNKRNQFMKILFITLISIVFSIFLPSCAVLPSETTNSVYNGNLIWVREESYFSDYAIEGDTVTFKYVLCFKNTYGIDCTIRTLGIILSEDQTSGWLESESTYFATEIGGKAEVLIPAGQTVYFDAVFEGTYLGGEINSENLFPKYLGFVED